MADSFRSARLMLMHYSVRERALCPEEFAVGQVIPLEAASTWLKRCGVGVKIYRGCRLVPPEAIAIGDYSQIDEGVRIFAGGGVTIGRHVHMAFSSSVSGGGSCLLDDFAGIGAGVRLITGTDLTDAGSLSNPTVPPRFRQVHRGQIHVGAHAVIFTNAIVFPDVEIGEGTVVAAGSVVHHSLRPWAVFAGNPLVQVGTRDRQPILERAAKLQAQDLPS